jgi:hypothetical protein
MEEVWTLLDYPDDDVKAAAVEAISFFLIAYYKSGVGTCKGETCGAFDCC